MAHRNEFKDAADEIAQDFLRRQFPDNITADDAREHVDTNVITSWWAIEGLNRSENAMLGDLITERLTPDQARTVICALAIGHADKVQEVLQAALVEEVAWALAYEAQNLYDSFEPGDDYTDRRKYAADVDDPVASDRRALARASSAYARLGREWPL